MNEEDIANGLGQALDDAMLGYPVVWENRYLRDGSGNLVEVPSKAQMPYLVVEFVRTSRRNRALAGGVPKKGSQVSEGFMQITVVSERDAFASAATGIADDVADVFTPATSITITGGKITITDFPTVIQGFPDDVSWRVPVRVPYRATST